MKRSTHARSALVLAALFGFSVLLASCGSSSKAASTTTKAPAASTTPAATALVTAKTSGKLGTILADQSGMTLYTLTKNGKPVACTGPCLSAWPPLELPAGASAPNAATGITGLSASAGSGGAKGVAVNGLPLYHFVRDQDKGDAYGEGVTSFGGTWHVAKTTAAPTPASGATPTTSETTTTSSSGY